MGDSLGPDASEIDLQLGRWINYQYKADVDLFYTERAPRFHELDVSKERSGGFAIDLLQIPAAMDIRSFSILGSLKVRAACEFVHDINWQRGDTSLRTVLLISGSLWPTWASWTWR